MEANGFQQEEEEGGRIYRDQGSVKEAVVDQKDEQDSEKVSPRI
jgi:hypothetical protein